MKRLILLMLLLSLSLFGKGISVSDNKVKQGEFFIVYLDGDTSSETTAEKKITFSPSTAPIKIYELDGRRIALVPVHYSISSGSYEVKVTENNLEIFSEKIKVIDGEFQKSYITVDKNMNEKKSTKNVTTMINHARNARANSEPTKLWEGEFADPTGGARKSSPFGAMRFVNDKISGYHSGTDFAVPIGTPLKSVNSGKVVMAMYLNSTGNTIIVDHGLNLFSSYSHLETINVEVGEMIDKEKVIGTSGNTGFTTGPHLHLTMSIGNTFINPILFLDNDLL